MDRAGSGLPEAPPARRRGFTLIEMSAVLVIVFILISLVLPAVQAAREAGRRIQCVNALTQLGVALASYEATFRLLPPGVIDQADPVDDAPTGYRFGWFARILPHLERTVLANNLNLARGVHEACQTTARFTAIGFLVCPVDPWRGVATTGFSGMNPTPVFARISYAACHHDSDAPIAATNQGAFPLNGRIASDEIEDGLGATIFLGEKRSGGDEMGWAVGTRATLRNTGIPLNETALPPIQDLLALSQGASAPKPPTRATPAPIPTTAAGVPVVGGFGSYHPAGSNFLFGDGSVRLLKTSIDRAVYRRLGNRRDGQSIGADEF